MRARIVPTAALAITFGGWLVACVDLFHGTSFASACDVDAAACAPLDANVADDAPIVVEDAGTDGPTNFCAWSSATAAANAAHACAWLGACEGAFDDNAFGPCMVHAVLAYDCATNPNRPVIGAAHAYWDCLWQATTCGDVANCVEPSGTRETCAGAGAAYVACDPSTAALIACGGGVASGSPPAGLESCAALGQTCTTSGPAECSGSTTACSGASSGAMCAAGTTRLHDCDPDGGALDYGVDCASFGAGSCFSGAFGACLATDGAPCAPQSAVTCEDGGVAVGCPSGVTEQIDCDAVLGVTGGASTCNPQAPGRQWDVSRACSLGTCDGQHDSCDPTGPTITTCFHGATFSASCKDLGFTSCALATYPGDPSQHAYCTP
jgi:hypothetical protein